MPLPTFLIIGAQKSGTRWLRQNLAAHRLVHTADHEVEFFNHHFDSGVDWYAEQFDPLPGEAVIGEATPGYMFLLDEPSTIAERIESTLGGDTPLVALLRDPVARVRSSYLHHLRRDRIDADVAPTAFLGALDPDTDPLGIVSGGWYGRSLAPFAERFGRLHVELHADIATSAEAVFVRVLEHIGVDDPWVPSDLHDVVFSGVHQVAKRFPDHPILTMSDDEIREAIGAPLQEDTELLEQILGRALPWSTHTTEVTV